LDSQEKKIDAAAKPYVGKFSTEELELKAKKKAERDAKIKAAQAEGDLLFEDTNFDEASLSVYGAELGEQVSTGDGALHEIQKEKDRK